MNKKGFMLYICFVLLFLAAACNTATDEENARHYGYTYNNNQYPNEGEINRFEMGDDNHLRHYTNNISAESTDTPSSKYPHTKAVQIQEAKFDFQVVKGDDGKRYGGGEQGGANAEQRQGLMNRIRQGIGGGQGGEGGAGGDAGEQQQQPGQQQDTAAPDQQQGAPVTDQDQQERQQEQQEQQQEQPSGGISQAEQRVIELTNEQRRNNGLSELEAHGQLSNVARTKSNDMQENNYFSHTSPTYGSPFDMIRDHDVEFNAAAENIAQGQQTPEQVVESWMNSEGHRGNILNGNFTHIGVGYDENGHHWTQMFITQ
ncbi:CAP domain-containing protein [Evansella clarkii]|uniref:CAP domain-containing protein n=1 Tax=Evansella clarkii TaxID=79879 RepID=UPI001F1E7628|nr:CAP domain-containing protein [Evansella clarkii]